MIRTSMCQRNRSRGILVWYARIFDTETKEIRYESLGTTRKTEAKDIMEAKIREGAFTSEFRQRIPLKKAIDLYLEHIGQKGCSERTLETYRYSFDHISPLYGECLQDITKHQLLQAFLDGTEDQMPKSKNRIKTIVKGGFKYFSDVLELIPRNIADILPSTKDYRKERDFWTVEQIDRILDKAPSPDFRLLWSLMAFAGLRIHEATKVKKEDFRDGFLYVVGKGNKPAKVPVCNRLAKELERCNWTWTFNENMRNRWYIKNAAAKAIPEGFHGIASNHRFRHSFASNMIRSGVGVKQCQKLLRHASISTTLDIYSHLLDEDLEDSIEKMFK